MAHQAPRHASHGQPTPQEVLSWLPETATPWQQDSAIRANIKFPQVDWSKRHNPMRTPTTKADERHFPLRHPFYHTRSLVQPDSIYRPEYATTSRLGVAGDPMPYTIAGDNLITSLLLACFIFAAIAMGKSGSFLHRQIKNFFYPQSADTDGITETGGEVRFQFFLVLQTCLLSAIIFFLYSSSLVGAVFSIPNYQVIGAYSGIVLIYFAVKSLLQAAVQWVFFDRKKIEQWTRTNLFIISLEGVALFPIVLLLAYFDLSVDSAVIYTLIVVILVKMLSFYKSHIIFFKRDTLFLQTFLYFCALEIMPLGALWIALEQTVDYLKVIF